MKKITVIGTSHKEGGACTSDELIRIIQEISPNVIFCEAPVEKFQAMLKATESFNPPEIKALRAIIEKCLFDIIPVDINVDPFDGRLEAMHRLFRQRITEYYYATEIQAGETYRKGFPFLNSEDCDQIHRDKSSMELAFVANMNDLQLSKTHNDWLKWNETRENHWISVIHDYFTKNKSKTAVFLVGSAHRIRLVEKIKGLHNTSELIPEWNFYPFK
jgi:hypothetical protein